jgi:hypothetical protein
MKRRITAEQLQKLTNEQKQKLRDWWGVPNYGDFYADINIGEGCWMDPNRKPVQTINNCLPLLDIGQMIELLGDKWVEKVYYALENIVDGGCDILKNYEGELCDALWEAVKEILNREAIS